MYFVCSNLSAVPGFLDGFVWCRFESPDTYHAACVLCVIRHHLLGNAMHNLLYYRTDLR